MSFYGNITNTSKTTFSFDKIYANRRDMDDACASGDGVFLGRYVLVEYGASALDNIQEVYTDQSLASILYTLYSDPIKRDSGYIIPWVEHKIVKIKSSTSSSSYVTYKYYEGRYQSASSKTKIWYRLNSYSNSRTDDQAYKTNYDIDYGKYKRGYDSTVWIKQFINNEERYVQIAELNTIVPVFEILPQAPQDIYTLINLTAETYKPNTYYYFDGTTYVKDSGSFTEGRKYYSVYTNVDGTPYWPPYVTIDTLNSTNVNYRIQVPTNFLLNLDPQNIDFNSAGFNKDVRHFSNDEENSITYTLGTTNYPYYYDVEQDGVPGDYKTNDIKNLVIKLPGLGNAVCRVYDLLYGEERNLKNYSADNISGALNRLNKKLDTTKLTAGKPLILSSKTDSDIEDYLFETQSLSSLKIGANSDDLTSLGYSTTDDPTLIEALKKINTNSVDSAGEVNGSISDLITKINNHINNANIHVSLIEKAAWNKKLDSVPDTYIQKSDTFTVGTEKKNIEGLCSLVDTLRTNVDALPTEEIVDNKISSLNTKIADLEKRIADLEGSSSTGE